jgi:carboxymethylenebutenolidase
MEEFHVDDRTISGYLAVPEQGHGPGVVVLHGWWGLTEPFRRACDRLAAAGFVALAPDLYHGPTTAAVEEAAALGGTLDENVAQWSGDIAAAVEVLRRHPATQRADGPGKVGLVGFSLGGGYALVVSTEMAGDIAAVAIFYDSCPGLDYSSTEAAYLLHYAENDQFKPAGVAAEMEQELQAAGRPASVYVYPGTEHWFMEENRPEYHPEAARLAWERTLAFLPEHLD